MNLRPPYQLYGTTAGSFYPSAGVIPKAATGTGSVAVANNTKNVTGTGTIFLTEVSIGDWIYFPTTKQLRQIVDVVSNTALILDSAVTSAVVAGEALQLTIPRFKSVLVKNQGAGVAILNGETVVGGQEIPMPGATYGTFAGVVPVFKYDKAASELSFLTI